MWTKQRIHTITRVLFLLKIKFITEVTKVLTYLHIKIIFDLK